MIMHVSVSEMAGSREEVQKMVDKIEAVMAARGKSDMPLKRCTKCEEEKPADLNNFVMDRRDKSGLGSWCKPCKAKWEHARKERIKAAKASQNGHSKANAPIAELAVVGISEQCGCCGTTRGNIIGDVDSSTFANYGYLCMKCYRLVRDFQGDAERIRKVLDYVERTRQKVPTSSQP